MPKHTALLLINLGSPDSTHQEDIRKYLTEFLMDKNVIDFPYILRSFLVKQIIVPKRTSRSSEAYKKIWQQGGSPLIIYSNQLREKVQNLASFPVALAMRYGEPAISDGFQQLLTIDPRLEEVVVLPLYPHYTMSSFGTAVDEVKIVYNKGHYPFKIKFLNPFYNNEDYQSALADSIRPYLKEDYDKILFSYHGVPERHLRKDASFLRKGSSDFEIPLKSYQEQTLEATELTAGFLNIPKNKYETSFQSRLSAAGKDWVKPYTAHRISELPSEGVKKLLVVCPGFINDCLETLEEIGMEGKEEFLKSGGEKYTIIPCLNDQDQFAELIVNWVLDSQKL